MIVTGHLLKDEQLLEFLCQNDPSKSPEQWHSWMQNLYMPENLFALEADGKIAACLQVSERIFLFRNKKTKITVLDFLVWNEKELSPEAAASFLDTILGNCSRKHMLTLTLSEDPAFFLKRGFGILSTRKQGLVQSAPDWEEAGWTIQSCRSFEGFYAVYTQFLSFFDGSVRLEPKELEALLKNHLQNKGRVWKVLNPENQISGFAVTHLDGNQLVLETAVYSCPQALAFILSYFSSLYEQTLVTASGSEPLETLVNAKWKPAGSCMIRINDLPLLARWLSVPCSSYKKIFESLEKPSWNLLF